MGLCSHLNDVSSDSIPLLFVAIIANCVCYIRSLVFGLFQSMGFSGFDDLAVGTEGLLSPVGSGLAGLIVLTEQLNVNPVFAYREVVDEDGNNNEGDQADDEDDHGGLQCIVCLCRLRDGDQVRKLACRHVFHKNCLDGWLFDHFNLTCPLCRSPLVSQQRVVSTERGVVGGLIAWFSMT
ncbi:zinc finger protein [Macleaya cordata]|uniref:Zinc finger protein n=1 Tax=Macleaya cordata TaxID=56857 RepID=A0A200QUU3_MACCD|nr:zinc finger protein [Macleaya cordata]